MRLFCIAIISLMIMSCQNDDDASPYQTLMAEMADAYTNSDKQVTHAINDRGVDLVFTKPVKLSWMQTPDSCYRTLIYYNKVLNSAKAGSELKQEEVEPVGMTRALMLRPRSLEEAEEWYDEQDAVALVSGWRTQRYVNLCINVMTGVAEDRTQTFGLVLDSVTPEANYLRLTHDQNGVPRAYTESVYFSIPLDSLQAPDNRLVITIPTDKGKMVRQY